MNKQEKLNTGLIKSAEESDLANIKLLIKQGAMRGHLEVVQYLVEHGANINAEDDNALRLSCYVWLFRSSQISGGTWC